MKTILIALIVLLLSSINISFAYIFNYGFLDDTAGVYFTDQDWKIFEKTQLNALNNTPDGVKRTWKNPQSGSWGSFVPSKTFTKNNMHCRALTIVNAANYRIGQSTLTFCKVNGDWRGV